MKLSRYAKHVNISYQTTWRWWKAGSLDAYQTDTGTVIVRDPARPNEMAGGIALYARVSAHDQKTNLEWQIQRIREYAAARGYRVQKEVIEIASDLNDQRPKFLTLLSELTITTIIVEHRDRGTRFRWIYLTTLLEANGRRIEAVFPNETKDELAEDFVAVITSMATRLYGRHSQRRTRQIKACVEQVMEAEVGDKEGHEDHTRL